MQTSDQLVEAKAEVQKLALGNDLAPAHHHTILETVIEMLTNVFDELISHRKAIDAIQKAGTGKKTAATSAKPTAQP